MFGLAATRNIGIGQAPRKMARHLDIVHPMVYPSAYGAGECNIDNPVESPGRIVNCSLQDYRQTLSGRDVTIIPWLQDYGSYGIDEIRAQVAAAERWQTGGYLLWNGARASTPTAHSTSVSFLVRAQPHRERGKSPVDMRSSTQLLRPIHRRSWIALWTTETPLWIDQTIVANTGKDARELLDESTGARLVSAVRRGTARK